MKNIIAKAGLFVAAGLVAFSVATAAQAATLMRVNIPFTFLAGGQMHSAGVYWVRVDTAPRTVELQPVTSAIAERVALNGAYVRRSGKDLTKGFLRFERFGSTYALRAVGPVGAEDGLGVKQSKIEEQLAQANGGAPGTEVELQ